MRVACPGLSRRLEEACAGKKTTILTQSRLLAAVTSQQFASQKLNSGVYSWERPSVFSINAWLTASWQEARYNGGDIPALLSPAQERLLWRTVIQQDHSDLFDLNATAALARSSAQLLAEYQIPSEGDAWADNQDAQNFQQWNLAFRRRCKHEGWIAHHDLWELIPQWIGAGQFRPGEIVFAGFTSCHPAMQQLKCALGHRATWCPSESRGPFRATARASADFQEQIEFAARWARSAFDQQPSRSIAIVVPDLPANRSLLERTFQQVFYPSQSEAQNDASSVFHISNAAPLREHPVVASALLILELARPRLHLSEACAIIRCPFLPGSEAERSARALADLELRKQREIEVSSLQIESATRRCSLLTRMWPRLRRVLRARSDRLALSGWAKFIADLLEALGWPGDSQLTQQEQDILESWKDTLSSLSALGMVCGNVSYDAALTCLASLLMNSGLEIGDWFSPVQILDAQEAFELEFDCACLTGLSDETWPPFLKLSPLVPFELQRANHVPGSSPESAWRERERMTAALFSTAHILAATYSGRLSPAAERFCDKHADQLIAWSGKLPRQSFERARLQKIEDFQAPPYRATGETRGGTSVIKAQSLCSFRAFAQKRLNASRLEDACFGFDARERGTFSHEVLHYVWQQIQTQARLRSMSLDERLAVVREAIDLKISEEAGSAFHRHNRRAERKRVEQVVMDWLELDARRQQPFEVEITESKRSLRIGGLDLNVRIDRVDRLWNDRLVLIDYKSGKTDRKDLDDARPAEPQLLVYAAAFPDRVDGIFFGELTPRRPRATGFARANHFGEDQDVRPDWDEFMLESHQRVERIARSFSEGYAGVDPLRNACTYCGGQPFCRVRERHRARGSSGE